MAARARLGRPVAAACAAACRCAELFLCPLRLLRVALLHSYQPKVGSIKSHGWYGSVSAACGHIKTTPCPSLFLFGCTRRLAAAISGGLERPCGGSGRRGHIHPFAPPAPTGARRAAHARPGPGRRLGQDSPCAAGLCHWHIPCYLAAAAGRRPKAEQGLSLTAAPTGAPTGATSARPWPRSGSPTVSPLAVPGCLGAPVSRRAESRPRGLHRGRLNTYWRRRVSTVDSVERSFTAGSGLSRTAGKLAAPLRGRHSGREPRVSRRGPRARDPGNALQARVRSRPRAGARNDGGEKDPRTRTVRRSRRSSPRTVGGRRGPRSPSAPSAIKASDALGRQRRRPETSPPGARLAAPLASPGPLVL